MTLDVTTGELFVPVGNPWPDLDRAYAPEPISSPIRSWSWMRALGIEVVDQVSPADWQDLDMVAPPVLYRADGARDVLVFGGKDGYVTAVDRDTHQQLFRRR